MERGTMIYVVGAGGIGMPLAALLASKKMPVTAVRTSIENVAPQTVDVVVGVAEGTALHATVQTVSLSKIDRSNDDGLAVVTTKATANRTVAPLMLRAVGDVPVVVLQNGIGVEEPFVRAGFSRIYRGVLYATGQRVDEFSYRFREVSPSPIGPVHGGDDALAAIAESLSTQEFRFRTESRIEREVWKKAILNAAFNAICPLITIDNGVFDRDRDVARIARTVIEEAASVARGIGVDLETDELMEHLLLISRRARGQLISTLQDLLSGRETEIEFLNVAISQVGASLRPPIDPKVTRILGELVQAKSRIERAASSDSAQNT